MFQWSLGFLIEFWSDRFEVIFLFDLCNCNCFFYRSVTAHLNYSILLLPKIFQHVLVYYWVWSWWGFFFCVSCPFYSAFLLYMIEQLCYTPLHFNVTVSYAPFLFLDSTYQQETLLTDFLLSFSFDETYCLLESVIFSCSQYWKKLEKFGILHVILSYAPLVFTVWTPLGW